MKLFELFDGKFNLNISGVSFLIFSILAIAAVGYLLGKVTIKGVNLGTAGVFLVAILVGWLCTLNFKEIPLLGNFHVASEADSVVKTFKSTIQNTGLILFVGAVGFIAGPNFFKDLKKNFKTYITLGVIIILSGTAVAAEKANLNTATRAELAADPNIGPELAEKIAEFRENVGDFTKYEDLKEIEGIDDAKIKQINEKFQIEGVASFDCNC